MSKCYTFDEWLKACNELHLQYRSCISLCYEKETDKKLLECLDKCEETLEKYAAEKYGLEKDQAWLCSRMG